MVKKKGRNDKDLEHVTQTFDSGEEDLNIDQEIKKNLKSIKMREESAFITPLIEQKLLVSRVSLESLKYRKARRENNKNFGDYDLSNFYNLINEANNQLNKYKLSNLWLLDIYGIPISIYKDKGEPISELSIDLCKKMMKIIFPGDNETLPVKNENWLSMNLTFCILNFLLLGDFKSVNDAFSRLHLENTNVVVNVFNKIFIDRDSSEEPKQFIENINVYKKTDDYLMLKDLFI